MNNPQQIIWEVAFGEIGTHEDPVYNNMGEAIRKYKEFTELNPDDAWPWCAAFVSYCIDHANEISDAISLQVPPRLAAAFAFEDWGQKYATVFRPGQQSYTTKSGDIVVFNFSHCGIVEKLDGDNIVSIDGNTNDAGSREGDGVYRKERALSLVRCFVRIPARAKAVV